MTDILDISGLRFGLLTAIKCIEIDQRGARWDCECWCGRRAIRYAAQLRRAVKLKQSPQCRVCLEELRRGHFIDQRNATKDHLLDLWTDSGVLWTELDLKRLECEIRTECLRQGIDAPSTFPTDAPEPTLPIFLFDNEGTCQRLGFDIEELDQALDSMRENKERQRQTRALAVQAKRKERARTSRALVALETERELEIFRHNVRHRIRQGIAERAFSGI